MRYGGKPIISYKRMNKVSELASKFQKDLEKLGVDKPFQFGPLPLKPPGRKEPEKQKNEIKQEKQFQKVIPEKLKEFILFVNSNIDNKVANLLDQINLLKKISDETGIVGIKLAFAAEKVSKGGYNGTTSAKEELEPLFSAYLKLIAAEEDVLKRINFHSESKTNESLQILIDNINNLIGK